MFPLTRRRILALLAGVLAPPVRANLLLTHPPRAAPSPVPQNPTSPAFTDSDGLPDSADSAAFTESDDLPQSDDLPESSGPLESWLRLPIQPVWHRPDLDILDAPDHPFHLILQAIRTNAAISILYHGGSSPGSPRVISPALVFTKLRPTPANPATAPHYVLAWCHHRQALRTFRLDRIEIPDTDSLSEFPLSP